MELERLAKKVMNDRICNNKNKNPKKIININRPWVELIVVVDANVVLVVVVVLTVLVALNII